MSSGTLLPGSRNSPMVVLPTPSMSTGWHLGWSNKFWGDCPKSQATPHHVAAQETEYIPMWKSFPCGHLEYDLPFSGGLSVFWSGIIEWLDTVNLILMGKWKKTVLMSGPGNISIGRKPVQWSLRVSSLTDSAGVWASWAELGIFANLGPLVVAGVWSVRQEMERVTAFEMKSVPGTVWVVDIDCIAVCFLYQGWGPFINIVLVFRKSSCFPTSLRYVLVSEALIWKAVGESARMWMNARDWVVSLAVRPVSTPRAPIAAPVILATRWSLMAIPVKQQVNWSWEYLLSCGSRVWRS